MSQNGEFFMTDDYNNLYLKLLPYDLLAETVALVISILMVLGIAGIS